jgi:hypothetical protein
MILVSLCLLHRSVGTAVAPVKAAALDELVQEVVWLQAKSARGGLHHRHHGSVAAHGAGDPLHYKPPAHPVALMLRPGHRHRARVARTVSAQPQATGALLGHSWFPSWAPARTAVAHPADLTEFHVAAKFLRRHNVSDCLWETRLGPALVGILSGLGLISSYISISS